MCRGFDKHVSRCRLPGVLSRTARTLTTEQALRSDNKIAPFVDYLRESAHRSPEAQIRERGYEGGYTAVKRFVAAWPRALHLRRLSSCMHQDLQILLRVSPKNQGPGRATVSLRPRGLLPGPLVPQSQRPERPVAGLARHRRQCPPALAQQSRNPATRSESRLVCGRNKVRAVDGNPAAVDTTGNSLPVCATERHRHRRSDGHGRRVAVACPGCGYDRQQAFHRAGSAHRRQMETGAGEVHVSGGEGRHGPEVKPARRFRWSMQAEDRAAPCIASLVPLRC